MNTRDDLAFVEDMLERIKMIVEFTADGYVAFHNSRLVQEAVLRSLEIIGEASNHISEQTRNNYPEIPWREIIAFRNFVIHAYWNVKLDRVWKIVDKDLPLLQTQLENVKNNLTD